MAVNELVEKVRVKGDIPIYGSRSMNLGEFIFLVIAIALMWKGGVNVKNKFVIIALLLIALAFIVW